MINDELLFSAYKLREKLVTDNYRPRYHFLPPEGKWNDMNGSRAFPSALSPPQVILSRFCLA